MSSIPLADHEPPVENYRLCAEELMKMGNNSIAEGKELLHSSAQMMEQGQLKEAQSAMAAGRMSMDSGAYYLRQGGIIMEQYGQRLDLHNRQEQDVQLSQSQERHEQDRESAESYHEQSHQSTHPKERVQQNRTHHSKDIVVAAKHDPPQEDSRHSKLSDREEHQRRLDEMQQARAQAMLMRNLDSHNPIKEPKQPRPRANVSLVPLRPRQPPIAPRSMHIVQKQHDDVVMRARDQNNDLEAPSDAQNRGRSHNDPLRTQRRETAQLTRAQNTIVDIHNQAQVNYGHLESIDAILHPLHIPQDVYNRLEDHIHKNMQGAAEDAVHHAPAGLQKTIREQAQIIGDLEAKLLEKPSSRAGVRVKALQAQLSKTTATSKALQMDLQKRLSTLEARRNRDGTRCKELRDRVDTLAARNEALGRDNMALRDASENHKLYIEELEEYIKKDDYARLLKAGQAVVNEMGGRLKSSEESLAHAHSRVQELESEVSDLRTCLLMQDGSLASEGGMLIQGHTPGMPPETQLLSQPGQIESSVPGHLNES